MNKIYKLVWSKARNMYVAVAEIARSHTKGPKSGVVSHMVAAGVLAAVIACGAVMPAYADAPVPGIGINNLNTEATNYDGSGAMGYDSIAIGDAKAAGGGSVAVGTDALTTGTNAIAIGAGSTATGDGTTREQINAILSNNKAIRDGLNEARGAYTISEQDYLRQKEIFDGQNEAVARVNHANELIAGYQAEINNTLKPNATAADGAYNTAKNEYDTLYNDFANRILNIKAIDFSLYANTSTGVVDRDAIAAALKTQTEEGTTFNMPQSFYRNYVDAYIKLEGDMREKAVDYDLYLRSNTESQGALTSSGVSSFTGLENSLKNNPNQTSISFEGARGSYTNFADLYKSITGKVITEDFYRYLVNDYYYGPKVLIDLKTGVSSVDNSNISTSQHLGASANSLASNYTYFLKNTTAYTLPSRYTKYNLSTTTVYDDTAYNEAIAKANNTYNILKNRNYISDDVNRYNSMTSFFNKAVEYGFWSSSDLQTAMNAITLKNEVLETNRAIGIATANYYHEQYLYEKYRDEGNEAEALIHLGLKEKAKADYETASDTYLSFKNDEWLTSKDDFNQLLGKIRDTLILPVGDWFYNEYYTPIHDTNVVLKEVQDGLDGALADKKQALDEATAAKKAADQALANKQNQINKAQPSQEDLNAAAEAEQTAQELQQKKDKLDADKEALEAAKANLVNLETIASDGENAIAIGGNAISTGNAGIGIGADVIVTGENAVGIGKNTIASGKNSVAVGPSNSVAKENGVAVGNNNGVTGMNSIAIGTGNVVSGAGSVAIGNGLNVAEDNVVVLGGKKMTAMADGTVGLNSTDAVTGNQLYQETRFINVNTEKTEGEGATGTDSVAVGIDSKVTGDLSTSIGNTNTITGKNSIAVGTGHTVSGNNSGAIGDPNIVNGDNSYAVGNNSTIAAGTADVFVLGNNVNATASNTVVLGSNSDGSQANTVSVGSAAQKRRIVNVANGTSATDVATMGQTIELVAGDNVTVTADGTNDAGQKKFKISSTGGSGGINYADQYHSQVVLDGSAYLDSEGNPQDGTTLSGLKDALLSASSTEAVTGAQLYKTNRDVADTNTALSQTNATVASMQTDVTTLKTNYTVLRSQYDTTKTQVETGFNVTANGAKVKTVNPDSNYIDFKAGDGITITNDNGAVKITNSVQADGQVVSGDTKVVSGDTVYKEVRPDANGNYIETAKTTGENLTALDTAVKANEDAIDALDDSAVQYDGADKSKVTLAGTGGTTIDNLKDGTLSATSKEAVNGSQLFTTNQNLATETAAREAADTVLSDRIGTLSADGNYILKDNNVSTNLSTLDTAIKGLADGKANTGLDNITDGGKTVIRDLAKESVKVVAGEHTTVTEGTDGNAKNYAVNVTTDGLVADGDTNVVSGGTVYDALQAQKDTIDDALDLKANKDASNVADQTAKWGAAIGTGAVAEGNGELVTGGTMFTELRPADGTYVKNANTTAANLTALDGQVKTNADDIAGLKDLSNITDNGKTVIKDLAKGVVNVVSGDHANVVKTDVEGVDTYTVNVLTDGVVDDGNTGVVNGDVVYDAIKTAKDDVTNETDTKLEGYAKIDGSNVTTPATWGQKLGTGAVADGNSELVTGDTVFTEVRPIDGTYVKNANTTGANLNALDNQVKANADAITDLGNDKANVDASNVTDATAWGTKIATGAIAEGDVKAVSGDTVYKMKTAMETSLDGKANVSLDNLNTDGNRYLQQKAIASVKVADGDNTTVTSSLDADGNITYKVKANATGAVETNDTGLVDGGTVYNALQEQKTATDTELDKKANKDASNVADQAEAWGTAIGTGAVTADDGKLVTGKTMFTELRPEDGTYVKNANTTAANLKALDGQVKTNADDITNLKDLSNITNAGETVIKNLAKGAVNVVSGDNANVVKTDVDGVDTYTVNVLTDGAVADGNTGVVSGDTVYDAIQNTKNEINEATDTKLEGYAQIDGSNVTTPATWGEKLGTGAVAEGNGELVTGGTMFTELRPADGTYVKNANTTAANLSALDGQVKTNTDDITNLKDLSNITNDGQTVIKNLAKGAVNVVSGNNANVVKTDVEGVDTYTVNVLTDGAIEDGNTGVVSGDTVYDYVKTQTDAIDDALDGKANVDASNVTDATAWGQKIATGVVTEGDVKAVSGDTVAKALKAEQEARENWDTIINERIDALDGSVVKYDGTDKSKVTLGGADGTTIDNLKDAILSADSKEAVTGSQLFETNEKIGTITDDGTYVKAANDVSENLVALDSAVSELSDGKADTNLSNITNDGKTVVRNLAKEAVKVVNGTNTTVTEGEDGDAKTYAVNVVTDGVIAENNEGVVNGGTVYEYVKGVEDSIVTDLAGKANVDASNIGKNATTDNSGLWGEALGTGTVATDDGKLVTGKTMFTELRPTDGTYVKNANTTAANLNALDTQVKANTDAISNLGNDKANVTLDNITNEGKTVVRDLAKEAVKVVAGMHTTVIEGTDGDAKTYAVNVAADGEVVDGNTGIVSGDTVFDAINTAKEDVNAVTDTKLEGYAKVDGSNVTTPATWGEKLGTGEVVVDNGELVTGGTVYNALNDAVTNINTVLDGKANVALDNLTSDGETVVRDLAKEALNVVSGNDYVTVNKTADGNADSYSVSVNVDGRVSEGNVGIVTGGTVYDALKDTAELIDITTNSKLEAYAMKDASNVDAGVWGTKLGTGKVNASDGKLVSGKTVAGETRVANNGNYILKDNSAAQNLSVLDTVLKETRDIAEAAATSGTDANAVHYDGDDKSSITLEGANGTKITNLSDGNVSATSTDAVTGRQLFETNENLAALDSRVGTVTDGNYVSADKSMGENINALDGQLKTVADGLDTVRTDVDGLKDTVSGFEVKLDGKADTDLGNLTDGGKGVIADIAKASVKVKGAGVAKVTSAEEGNATVYTVNVQADGKVEENNTGVVNGGTVYNSIYAVRNEFMEDLNAKADTDLSNITVNGKNVIREAVKDDLAKKADKADLNKKANVDASNIQVDAWAAKLGVGEIVEGNTGLVNGGTVYDAIQQIDRNNDIVEFKDDVIYMGAREGGNVISVYNNEGQGRVITGVITNPEDASSAANVGYVNAVGESIVGQMQNQFNRVDNKMNKVGANAAAMASLMPAPMDGDEKWSMSAAVGNYRNATAAAVGVFYKPQDNIMMNLRGSFGNDENMVGGGVSVALNRGNTPGVTKAQLVRAVNAQAAKIADQDAEIAELKAIVQQVAADRRQGK